VELESTALRLRWPILRLQLYAAGSFPSTAKCTTNPE
jgi:hypothetical protein